MQYFIEARFNKTVNTIISLGVVVAILNALIAIALSYGCVFFISRRDRAWPGLVYWTVVILPQRERTLGLLHAAVDEGHPS